MKPQILSCHWCARQFEISTLGPPWVLVVDGFAHYVKPRLEKSIKAAPVDQYEPLPELTLETLFPKQEIRNVEA
jgi:hypothetical protein